jgi:hypothetical protein
MEVNSKMEMEELITYFLVRTIYPQGYLAKNIEGFILMVDASDPNSFESAKSELNVRS